MVVQQHGKLVITTLNTAGVMLIFMHVYVLFRPMVLVSGLVPKQHESVDSFVVFLLLFTPTKTLHCLLVPVWSGCSRPTLPGQVWAPALLCKPYR